MKRFIIILFVSLLSIFTINGCGGGSDNSDDPTLTIFDKENIYASSYMSSADDVADAIIDGEMLIIAALGADWREKSWGPDEIMTLLGEDGAKNLLNQINDINTNKIAPALDNMVAYGEDLLAAEREIGGLINFAPGNEGEFVQGPQRFVFTTAFVILSAFTAAGLAVALEFKKNENSNTGDPVTDLVESVSDYSSYAWTAGSTFVISTAEGAATSIGSAGAKAYKFVELEIAIDVASAGKTAYDFGSVLIGINEECSDSPQAPSLQRVLSRIEDAEAETYYIGTSDNNGVFKNIPAGDWSFFMSGDNLVRTTICTSLNDNVTKITVPMEPIETIDEKIDNDGDGYSEEDGDCNDNVASIFPGATETCTDNIDNNCNGYVDCEDDTCSSSVSCQDAISPPDSVGNGLSLTLDITGYNTSFTPVFHAFGLGNRDDGPNVYPTLIALSTSIQDYNGFNSDTLSLILDPNFSSAGSYSLGDAFTGPGVLFTSREILNGDDGTPVVFVSVSGTVTLTAFGNNYGDTVSGSFTTSLEGEKDDCSDAACENTTRTILNGRMSGTFSGTIKTEAELYQ